MAGQEPGERPADRITLAGSAPLTPVPVEPGGPLAADEQVQATLVLRRRADPPPAAFDTVLTREELAARYGADPVDVDAVRTAVTSAGAQVDDVDLAARVMHISGPASVMNELFGTTLQQATLAGGRAGPRAGNRVRHPQGELSLPSHLAGVVTAVLGLDTRPQMRPRLRVAGPRAAAEVSYTPVQLGEIYRMPPGTDGTGQVLSIIELGGGYRTADLTAYFGELGIGVPDVVERSVDGAANQPTGDASGPDGEVMLDIEVAGALAPAAAMRVYFAPNTDAGFLDAVVAAAQEKPLPAAVSISWGASEDSWAAQSRTAMDGAFADAALLGITVTAAAGDSGSSDGSSGTVPHVDFPASSPHVLACGGTTLHADPKTGAITSETVWNDGSAGGATGGGVSDAFALPDWQVNAGVPPRAGRGGGTNPAPVPAARQPTPPDGPAGPGSGRGVPDVAAVADPRTGYQVRVDGQDLVYGGTSAVAPLWAALVCRLAQSLGKPIGLAQPALYAGVTLGVAPPGFRDVTSGNNGAYTAGPGWDACTGLGVPVGTDLLSRLGGGAAPPPGQPPGTGQPSPGQPPGTGQGGSPPEMR